MASGSLLPGAMIAMLALAGMAGESRLVSTLRGQPIAGEATQSPSLGYYEALIDQPALVATDRGKKTNTPPPGWLPFSSDQAGIVDGRLSYLHWTLKPDLDTRWNGKRFRTNHLGFRSPEIDLDKSAGTYRVVVFGSSNTMGYGVNDDELYTRHLENWLNARVGPSYKAEVVNVAVAGDSPSRRLARMQTEADRLSPDWMICDVSALDGFLEDGHVHAVVQNHIPVPFPFVADAIARSGVTDRDSMGVFQKKFKGLAYEIFDHAYAGWKQAAKESEAPLTVVILPSCNGKGALARDFELIRGLIKKHGLDSIDLSTAFDDREVDEIQVSEWDKHPNATGHRLIFEGMRSALLARGQLPGLTLAKPSEALVDRLPRERRTETD
jgi:lysophospholipase L1-like esterase